MKAAAGIKLEESIEADSSFLSGNQFVEVVNVFEAVEEKRKCVRNLKFNL